MFDLSETLPVQDEVGPIDYGHLCQSSNQRVSRIPGQTKWNRVTGATRGSRTLGKTIAPVVVKVTIGTKLLRHM